MGLEYLPKFFLISEIFFIFDEYHLRFFIILYHYFIFLRCHIIGDGDGFCIYRDILENSEFFLYFHGYDFFIIYLDFDGLDMIYFP